ncbi:MAG: peptidylprolyl isomerase [Acidobacteriota bacterium]|nr:peptidylprolyl isomerase [Acidobacteriota bacterium]MDH3524052.1 peptidylprolyl isomerase [Acidobacteriota bacterium]
MMRARRPAPWMAIACLAIACARPARDPSAIAAFDGGSVSIADVEAVILALPPERRLSLEASIFDTYRSVARQLALGRILAPDLPAASDGYEEWKAVFPDLHRQLVNRLFGEENAEVGQISVSEAEIEAYYQEHPEQFQRPERRLLKHLFRRHEDADDPAATLALMRDLRARLLAGASFDELAREHSQSETAALGGQLGWVGRGTLPPRLEKVAFALASGGISEPVAVAGGYVLFQAFEVVPEKRFTLAEVRDAIGAALHRERVAARVDDLVAGVEPPAGAIVLDAAELAAARAAADPERVILAIHDREVRWGQFAAQVAAGAPDWPAYRNLVRPHLLFELAGSSGFVDREDVRRKVATALRNARQNQIVEEALIAASRSSDAIPEETLRRFHHDHQQLYQTEPRARVRVLRVPLRDAPSQVAALTAAREALAAGETDLESVAGSLGGEVEDLGWQGAALEDLDPKARSYVLEVPGTGFSTPYHLDDRLAMIEVLEREAPRPLPFEEAADRVLDDYFARHQQELYEAAVERTLKAADFEYFEDRVREALAPG